MEFCPSCGMRLILKQKTINDNDHFLLICPKCDYTKQITNEEPFSPAMDAIKEAETSEQKLITIINDEQKKIRTMPVTKVECPKCKNRRAYWWMVQTRGADESSTQFFRCTKCDHTWRKFV
jgi:DNA-directed RNA polymerase subunit M